MVRMKERRVVEVTQAESAQALSSEAVACVARVSGEKWGGQVSQHPTTASIMQC